MILPLLALLAAPPLGAEPPPLVPEPVFAALAREASGESALRDLEALSRLHRMRGSRQFRAAAEHVAARLREAGLDDARIDSLPADGTVFYGTQRSRPAWNAELAELWELEGEQGARHAVERIASWDQAPITLAQDSWSGTAEAELVDVGEGTHEADYAAKDVRGKLVLAASQPGGVAELAVGAHGAAGIVSWAQNQKTAWWGDDASLVRWGHLDPFAKSRTFAFMVSPKRAQLWRDRLRAGGSVWLRAEVRAGQEPGSYDIATAALTGADPARRSEEIVLSCHLDHPRPGANDNASGCVTILEVARTLARLVKDGTIPRPARTIRFVWPPEIEGSLALLAGRPEWAARVKADIHLDMVGGGPTTKAVFHVTRGPASLPSFVNDVAEGLAAFMSAETYRYAATGTARYPLASPLGGREALAAQPTEFTMGSDHEVYAEGSWRIPAVYLNDWPDRYIHTDRDVVANIDPTKLKRAAVLAAATGWYLASFDADDVPALLPRLEGAALRRAATVLDRRASLDPAEAANLTRFQLQWERGLFDSVERFAPLGTAGTAARDRFLIQLAAVLGGTPTPVARTPGLVYIRNPDVRGPMTVFGYDYLTDKSPAGAPKLTLLDFHGARGEGGDYAYEALNLVDGRRDVPAIRDAVSAIYGPVPLDAVAAYLEALRSIGVLRLR